MTKFILVRHGEANYQETENLGFQDFNLAPLTQKGVEEVKETVENEIFQNCDILISSPYKRAVQTASIIGNRHNLDVNIEILLHEWRPYLTKDNTKTYMQNLKQAKEEHREAQKNPKFKPSATIESINHVRKRGLSVLERYCDYNKVIVVSHKLLISTLFEKNIVLHTGQFITTTSEELEKNFNFHPKTLVKRQL